MDDRLRGKKIAIVATDGFEQAELIEPRKILNKAGAQTVVVSNKPGKIRGWNHTEWSQSVPVDKTFDQVSADEFDALFLPGGVINADKIRQVPEAVEFTRRFFEQGKPVGAICHAPWLLVEAGVLKGRRVTSWPSLKTDLYNAGAMWEDSPCVTDEGLVTSRKPDDIPTMGPKLIEEFAEGKHPAQAERSGARLL